MLMHTVLMLLIGGSKSGGDRKKLTHLVTERWLALTASGVSTLNGVSASILLWGLGVQPTADTTNDHDGCGPTRDCESHTAWHIELLAPAFETLGRAKQGDLP